MKPSMMWKRSWWKSSSRLYPQLLVQQEDRAIQDLHPIGDVAARCKFLRRMADAGVAGNKNHSHGRQARDFPGVVHSSARKIHSRKPCRARRLTNCGLNAWIAEGWLDVINFRANGSRALFTVDVGEPLLRCRVHTLDLCGVKIAQLVRKLHAARNHVWRSGLGLEIADRANLATVLGANAVAHRKKFASGRRERVVAPSHRRRAGMVRSASCNALPAPQTNNALDHADGNFSLLEIGALLDVQL